MSTIGSVDILMYHSISDGAGPTCISPGVFRQQMAVLADCGFRGIALREIALWLRGQGSIPARSVVLTFDDGFQDFAETAFPELHRRGWTATVFLPAGKVGGTNDWDRNGHGPVARPLMTWKTVSDLAGAGMEFGGHGLTHADLTSISLGSAGTEIRDSKHLIEDRIGCPVTSFAAPYGKSNRATRLLVAECYDQAVGTDLARARQTSDRYDLPRIEMWYFRSPSRWRALMEGRGTGYFLLRKAARGLRQLITT